MSPEKRTLVPIVSVAHNDENNGFLIDVDLAGASKDSVELEMGEAGFCVRAEGEDLRYESCFRLGHEVKPDESSARFDSGLLKIAVPFRAGTRGTKVRIQ